MKIPNSKKKQNQQHKLYKEGIYINGPEINLYTQHVTEGLV